MCHISVITPGRGWLTQCRAPRDRVLGRSRLTASAVEMGTLEEWKFDGGGVRAAVDVCDPACDSARCATSSSTPATRRHCKRPDAGWGSWPLNRCQDLADRATRCNQSSRCGHGRDISVASALSRVLRRGCQNVCKWLIGTIDRCNPGCSRRPQPGPGPLAAQNCHLRRSMAG
jgi:hypothetical protein